MVMGACLFNLKAGVCFAIVVATTMGCIETRGANDIDNGTVGLTEYLARGYDKAIRPNCNRPTDVRLDFYIESFGKIEEANLEFSVFMYFRQMWREPRLANRINDTVTLQRDQINQLWFPDTYCSNAKKSDLMSPDHEIHSSLILEPDGTIFYSRASHIIASCEMDLRDFPMDKQLCKLTFGSYGYTDKDIKLSWESSSITIASKEMAQFSVKDGKLSSTTSSYVKGNYTLLTASFPMHRRIGYYAIQVYVPCTFLVMLSWIVFWMDPEETGNRLTVGITTILTIVFLLGYTNSTLPKVSYVKGMDWYLMVAFLFIFLSLVECIVVDKAFRDSHNINKNKKSKGPKQQQNINGLGNLRASPMLRNRKPLDDKPKTKVEIMSLNHLPHHHEPNGNEFLPEMLMDAEAWHQETDQNSVECNTSDLNVSHHERKRSSCIRSPAHAVDMCSRVLFPLIFVLYNVLYWYTYKQGVSWF